MTSPSTRRHALAGAATVATTLLAGCQIGGGNEADTADLRITSVGRQDQADAVRIQGVVRNDGEAAAEAATIQATFYGPDDATVGSDTVAIGRLDPGQTAHFTIEYQGSPDEIDDYTVKPAAE